MARAETVRGAEDGNPWLYVLAVVAALAGVVFAFAAVSLDGGRVFLAVPVGAVLLSASGAYLSGSYVISILLGLLPMYGVAVGEVVSAPYDGPLLVGIANLSLLFTFVGTLLTTVGFLLGTAVRYRSDLASRGRWLAVRVGVSAVLCSAIYVAAENGWVSYGVTLG